MNRFTIRGYAEVEIIDSNGNIKYKEEIDNNITDIGKSLMLSMSANKLLTAAGMGGKGQLVGEIGSISGHESGIDIINDAGGELRCYLLNLEDGELQPNTKYLNLQTNSYNLNTNKVIGFTGIGGSGQSEGYQGVAVDPKSEDLLGNKKVTARWMFNENIANGTFNHVAMMPGFQGDMFCNAINVGRTVNQVTMYDYNRYFPVLEPNIPGITGPYEIIIIMEMQSGQPIVYKRLDLRTYDSEVIEESIIPQPLRYNGEDREDHNRIYHNGYIYYMVSSCDLRRVKLDDGSVESITLGGNRNYQGSLFLEGDYLYTSGSGSTYSSRDHKINTNTFTVEESTMHMDGFVGGVPSTWVESGSDINIQKAGVYYYVSYGSQVIKCLDRMNVSGTKVASFIAPSNTKYINTPDGVYMIRPDTYRYSMLGDYEVTTRLEMYRVGTYGEDVETTGYNISKEEYSNVLSFVKLPTPKTKKQGDVMYITYGYEFI